MKKYLIIFIIFFSIKNIFPQSNLISFDSKISIESNTLDNNILNTFLYGGTINQELKDHWIGLSRKNNTVNGELSNGISFSKNLQSGNLLFSIFDRNNLNININKDLLKLILNGNYNYQGELLEFNSSNLRITRYQQYKIGYNLKLKKNQIKLAVSYLQGNHNINIVINEGSLFTYPNGESLDINYDINSFITDTSSYKFFNSNGNGFAIDFSSNINFNKSEINIYMNNLGYIKWNNQSINNSIDSSYSFNGITINNFNNLYDSILDYNDDYSLNIRDQNINYKTYISADIGINIEQKVTFYNIKKIMLGINSKWQPLIDDKRLTFNKIKQGISESNYKPKVYISTQIPYKDFNILCNLNNGGYSKKTNLDLGIEVNKKFTYIIGSKSINQMLKNNNKQIFSLYLSILKEI
jgi:hypothetical protein